MNENQKCNSFSIFDFLKRNVNLDVFYQMEMRQFHSRTVFQSLSELQKAYVLKLLFIDAPFDPIELKDSLMNDPDSKSQEVAIKKLLENRIFLDCHDNPGRCRLSPYFQTSFQDSLTTPIQPWTDTSVSVKCSPLDIERKCRESWGEILQMLMNELNQATSSISGGYSSSRKQSLPMNSKMAKVQRYSEQLGLISSIDSKLTKKGIEFVLRGPLHQVSEFLSLMLLKGQTLSLLTGNSSIIGGGGEGGGRSGRGSGGAVERGIIDLIDVEDSSSSSSSSTLRKLEYASFFLTVPSCQVGVGYLYSQLTENQKLLVNDLKLIGLCCFETINEIQYFFPSSLLIEFPFPMESASASISSASLSSASLSSSSLSSSSLSSTSLSSTSSSSCKIPLQIIVETNLQVIAYLNSDLDFNLLSLFVHVQLRLPNMAYGKLTRAKTIEALERGLSYLDMIDFLMRHPHPQVIKTLQEKYQSNQSQQELMNLLMSSSSSSASDKEIEIGKGMGGGGEVEEEEGGGGGSEREWRREVIPSNVSDQLKLWEKEYKRLNKIDCCYLEFSQSSEYFQCLEVCQQLDELEKIRIHEEKEASGGRSFEEFSSCILWNRDDQMLIVLPIRMKRHPSILQFFE